MTEFLIVSKVTDLKKWKLVTEKKKHFAYQLLPALFEGPVLALAVLHCKFFLSASKTIAYPGRTWPS